jgi:hypothetical protein
MTIFVTFGQFDTTYPHGAKPAMDNKYFYALTGKHGNIQQGLQFCGIINLDDNIGDYSV